MRESEICSWMGKAMTPIQTLEIRAGEIQEAAGRPLATMADLTDETRSELDKLKLEYADNDSPSGRR